MEICKWCQKDMNNIKRAGLQWTNKNSADTKDLFRLCLLVSWKLFPLGLPLKPIIKRLSFFWRKQFSEAVIQVPPVYVEQLAPSKTMDLWERRQWENSLENWQRFWDLLTEIGEGSWEIVVLKKSSLCVGNYKPDNKWTSFRTWASLCF